MNYLITGGLGHLGSHLGFELIKEHVNNKVIIVDNKSRFLPAWESNLSKSCLDRITLHNTDICDFSALCEIFEECDIDIVVHCGALTNYLESVSDPLTYYHNNINGMISLLRCMQAYQVHSLIYSSVYGETDGKTPYDRSKQFCEEMMEDMTKNGDSNSNWKMMSLCYFKPTQQPRLKNSSSRSLSRTCQNLFDAIEKTLNTNDLLTTTMLSPNVTPTTNNDRDIYIVDEHLKAIEQLNTMNGSDAQFKVLKLPQINQINQIINQIQKQHSNSETQHSETQQKLPEMKIIVSDFQTAGRAECFADCTKNINKLNLMAQKTIDDMCTELNNIS